MPQPSGLRASLLMSIEHFHKAAFDRSRPQGHHAEKLQGAPFRDYDVSGAP